MFNVGDIIKDVNGNEAKVLAVCGELAALGFEKDYSDISWFTIKMIEKLGCIKVKPEEKAKQKWLETGEKEGWVENGKIVK